MIHQQIRYHKNKKDIDWNSHDLEYKGLDIVLSQSEIYDVLQTRKLNTENHLIKQLHSIAFQSLSKPA